MADFLGFSKNGNHTMYSEPTDKDYLNACFAFENNNLSEAYLRFSFFSQQDCATLYNLALCFFKAKDYSMCEKNIVAFEKNFSEVSTLKQMDIPQSLQKQEYSGEPYLHCMLQDTPTKYPTIAKNYILCLKAELFYATNNTIALKQILSTIPAQTFLSIQKIRKNILQKEI